MLIKSNIKNSKKVKVLINNKQAKENVTIHELISLKVRKE